MANIYDAIDGGSLDEVRRLLNLETTDDAEDEYSETPLRYACRKGNQDIVEVLVTFGANVNERDGANQKSILTPVDGQTALHTAASFGYEGIVRYLLGNGALVNSYDDRFMSPLHMAVVNQHEGVVKALVEAGADINAWGEYSYTPLHMAVKYGSVTIVKTLIEAGAEIDKRNDFEQTPLHLAASEGRPWIARVLVDYGAEVDAQDRENGTPLQDACKFGQEEAAKVLIDAGANVNFRKYWSERAIHNAALSGHEAITRLLLKTGARINVRNDINETPLHIAAAKGHDAVVKALLEHGANPKLRKDPFYQTALHLAASEGHTKTVELLLEWKANVNALNLEKTSALHLAAYRGHEDVVQVLLDYGANVNLVCIRGRTVLHSACCSGNEIIITTLLEHGLDFSAHITDECCHQLSVEDIPDVFEMHFIKMKAAGLCRPDVNYVKYSKMSLELDSTARSQYQTACELEVILMKRMEIGDSGCSYYSLLKRSECVCRNEDAVKTLMAQDMKKDFFIYGRLLTMNFKKGLQRRRLLDVCYPMFPVVFRTDPHVDIVDKIFSYLTDRDLDSLSSILDRRRRPRKRRRPRRT